MDPLVRRLPNDIEKCVKLCVEDLHEPFRNEARWSIVRRYFSHIYNMGLRNGTSQSAKTISELVRKPWSHPDRRKKRKK